ncbi:DUF6477 family protein [Shimia sp.]|uniref:DUF6477 family protein n=1 Tax=Shimia sp. TaxID=1954381 RepID=UPI00329A47DB
MKDILSILNNLRRPRLLIRAARAGVAEYRRDLHLKRYFGYGALPRSGQALLRLMEMESDLNQQRRTSDAAYSLVKHVDILIAMMGEARLVRASQSRTL